MILRNVQIFGQILDEITPFSTKFLFDVFFSYDEMVLGEVALSTKSQ